MIASEASYGIIYTYNSQNHRSIASGFYLIRIHRTHHRTPEPACPTSRILLISEFYVRGASPRTRSHHNHSD